MTPCARIVRLQEHECYGTLGVLTINDSIFCATLEPPDRENAVNRSSIPAQQYTCQRYTSRRYGETFQVMNVPSRSYVLFHAGNTVDHTKGCILLGQYWGKLKGVQAVLNSGRTFDGFMTSMQGIDKFQLTVVEYY